MTEPSYCSLRHRRNCPLPKRKSLRAGVNLASRRRNPYPSSGLTYAVDWLLPMDEAIAMRQSKGQRTVGEAHKKRISLVVSIQLKGKAQKELGQV